MPRNCGAFFFYYYCTLIDEIIPVKEVFEQHRMNKAKDKIWLLITIAFAICLTIFTLSHIITAPAHSMPAIYGDGAKNYFTYLYQCLYGIGFTFEGMNYPYGENIIYTDGQPLLSLLFTSFHNPSLSVAVTTLWLLVGLSYVLCIVYNYKTLIHFKVSHPVAITFSGLICVLSPQMFRICGQYSLAYMCVIPMLFYWSVKYHELPLRKYCVYIFALGTIMSFLHPYFAGMMMLWVFSYIVGYIILTRQKLQQKIKHIIPMFACIISVLAIVAIVMKITDPVKDRPTVPDGVLYYVTHYSEVILSAYSPVWKHVMDHKMFGGFFNKIYNEGEGYDYIGIVTTLAIFFSLVVGVINIFRKNKTAVAVESKSFSPIWLFMALSTLLLSMGIPFIWHMEWLLDYVSVLRQFRTLGRFSWTFYYIMSVYGVIVLYNFYTWLIARRHLFIGYTVLLLSICLWGFEASGYIKIVHGVARDAHANYNMYFSKSEQNWKTNLQEHNLISNDFQAILLIGFFHTGSEKLWIGEGGWPLTYVTKASIQLHLPIVNVMMSRTSLSQTEKQVKIAAGPYADKPMLRDIKSNKPFLLMRYDHDSLDDDQKYLLEAADYIGHYSVCSVYAFYPDRQIANDRKKADSINKILPYMTQTDTCIMNKGDWYVNHMDKTHATDQLFGNGAMPCILGNDSTIAVIPIKPLTNNQQYEFSCWFLLNDKDCRSPGISLESLDSTGNIIATDHFETKTSVDNYNLWFRANLYFDVKADCRAIRCRVYNVPNPSYKVMDEILLRPSGTVIISKAKDGSVMVNNHLFRKEINSRNK